MLNIILCILMNLGILICFRLFKLFGIHTFQAIVINYVICVITGILFVGPSEVFNTINPADTWFWIGMALGLVFVSTFYLMAITTQKFSITVSSIASKMSLVIPVLFSLFILGVVSKSYSWLNYLGMVLTLPAIIFGSLKPSHMKTEIRSGLEYLMPIAVFLASGLIDSTINYTNYHFLTGKEEAIFPIITFLSAALAGILVLLIKRGNLTTKNLIGGTILGVVNYFSIYFLIRALSSFNNDGALVYPLTNVGLILISALISFSLFKERLTKLNVAGICLAIISIILISYQELFFISH